MVLVEAMDVGIPIVAPRNSSIPEVLGESHPGLYVTNNLDSLTNRMNELLSNKDLRSSIVLGQRNRLKLFSVEKYYSNHEAIYNQFLGIVQS
jgi:glycosyltransferase involved in cell wall biosynthesis